MERTTVLNNEEFLVIIKPLFDKISEIRLKGLSMTIATLKPV